MLNQDLIKALTDNCAPIRPLPHPAWRALVWFAVSLCYVAIVVAVMGVRPDFVAKIADPQFATELAAAFLTSVVAAARGLQRRLSGAPDLGAARGRIVLLALGRRARRWMLEGR